MMGTRHDNLISEAIASRNLPGGGSLEVFCIPSLTQFGEFMK